MKVVLSLVAVLALAVGFSLTALDGASAQCVAAPPPCGQGGCGGTAFVYYPKRVYAYWKQPGYTACYPGPGNCYWRRDCWYDSFGRRFCN